ncbi:hypothetical protein DY000_02004872 [Brassica cretica]|uniref:Uncharacterized protein n=1 Tax=Brassica cretica TaxID=69181 RepID=A0ABQ7CBQ9_BRACR|nr:hypothetical protein DY000_02004872 [Brassica cretica]
MTEKFGACFGKISKAFDDLSLWLMLGIETWTNSTSASSILSLHSGQLQLAFPYQPARDPTSISSRDFNSNLFVLPFTTTPSLRLDQHKTSSRPFQLVPVRVSARSNSRPFEVLLVVRFLQSANKSLRSASVSSRDPDCNVRDPIAISSRDFNSNSFVLPFATTPRPQFDQHRTSSRPFQLVPVRVPARSSSRPFEVLLVVWFEQSANKR